MMNALHNHGDILLCIKRHGERERRTMQGRDSATSLDKYSFVKDLNGNYEEGGMRLTNGMLERLFCMIKAVLCWRKLLRRCFNCRVCDILLDVCKWVK